MPIYLNFLRAEKPLRLIETISFEVGQDLQFLSIARGVYLVRVEKIIKLALVVASFLV